ncbi:proline iminopeptidase [Kribbella sp. VKM Ac-2569]|uniref:alpha/beta fold hydrolase n=1 Tax=Kribbella sp. VKM Ac-2569 TaxID=2512220 RepID=UPI00102BA63F|nr:alpha/beta hydrolase [Kribbella sp. VKM Ac-2569]RZT15220.1 proline iminopeptidase [Kribbella sp. VKM Ac-2569]
MLTEVRDTRLYVDQRGRTDAPPLLFVHGGPGAGSYDFMAFQGDRLAGDFHLIGVDQRGVQRSDALTGPVDEQDLIADFEALREQLGIEQWSLLGHSYGGRLALRYAVAHPDSITRVVFENPAWDMALATENLVRAALPLLPGAELPPHTGPATKQMWDERIALLGQLGDKRMGMYLGPDSQDLRLPADTELPDEYHERSGHFSGEITKSASFVEPVLQYLGQLTQPALLIKGEHDPATSPREIELFRSDVPDGTYYYASGAGHFLHAEQADLFARLVTEFLS